MVEGKEMNKILVIAAHPDDECLGCGGMIARMECVYVYFLGEGRAGEEKENQKRIAKVSNILGYNYAIDGGFEDNAFDTHPLSWIISCIEKVIEGYNPDTIFTHFRNDLNIDHRITYQATITAARPKGEVKEIYSYEVPTSTNWSFPLSFSPDFFIAIHPRDMGKKVEAMQQYTSELDEYKDSDAIWNLAKHNGYMADCVYAEAFETIRRVI